MKKQALLIAAAAAALTFAAPLTADAAQKGWNNINGTWFYADENGDFVSNKWVEDVYYINYDGKMISDQSYGVWVTNSETGESKYVNYLFGEDGKVIKTKGWSLVDEDWYWVTDDGTVGKGWLYDAGKWYYLSESDGRMLANTSVNIFDKDENGDDKDTYKTYWFKGNGEMVTGWYDYAPTSKYGSWVYADANGAAVDGWLYYGNAWYYLNDGDLYQNYVIVTDSDKAPKYSDYTDYDTYHDAWEAYADAHRYYFDQTGKLVYGWYHYEFTDSLGHYSDKWYYSNPSTGLISTGWLYDAGKWYYLDEGVMLRDTTVYDDSKAPEAPKYADYTGENATQNYDAAYAKYQKDLKAYRDSHVYIFNKDGAMVTGWYAIKNSDSTTWYYADADGAGHTGWIKDGKNYYYIQRGRMLTNTYTPDGYYVDANGIWR